jgi:lysophospholipase L1-like esterase
MPRLQTVSRYALYALVAALTLEVAARLDDWYTQGANPLEPYTINTLFRASEHVREGVPHKRFGKWVMNGLGYRGPELVAGRANIITFGASETFGLYERAGNEYPRQLENALNASGADGYNVVNIAIPGMRIGRISYLQAALDKTHARYVVVYPSPANYIGASKPYCGQKPRPSPPEHGLDDKLRIAGKVFQLTKTVLPDRVMTPLRQIGLWNATRALPEVFETAHEPALHAFVEDLRCVVNASAKSGARTILVTHANYFVDRVTDASRGQMIAWRRFYPDLSEAGMLDLEKRSNEAVRKLGAELGVPVVDAAAHIPGGAKYFADFVHFSDEGSALMAKLLAQEIQSLEKQPMTAASR